MQFTIKQRHDLKQWLLPKVKAAFENMKRKHLDGYWLPPSPVEPIHMEFLQALFEYLDWCFEEPIEERNRMLQTVHDLLRRQIIQNQSAIRRIA